MKTSELTGAALDWAVAQTMGEGTYWKSQDFLDSFHPSTNWAQGGPIIEREKIETTYMPNNIWQCTIYPSLDTIDGPTPLVAAMRCYVASKLGENIEVPKELL